MIEGTGSEKKISRRDALRLSALAAVAPSALALLPTTARAATNATRAVPRNPPIPSSWVVKDFDLNQIMGEIVELISERARAGATA